MKTVNTLPRLRTLLMRLDFFKINSFLFACKFVVINPFTSDSAKSKIDKFSKITNWVKLKNKQHHSKVLLNSFPMNGRTLGFCTWSQKLGDFVSPKVSFRESKG